MLATNEYGKVQRVVRETRSASNNHPNNRPKYGRLTTRKHLDCYLMTIVEVKVDEPPNTVVVIEAKHQYVQNGIPMVMIVTKDQTLFIPVINNTKVGLTLHPGTLLVTNDRVQDEQFEAEDTPVTISRISEALGPENDCVINPLDPVGNILLMTKIDWTR